MGRRLTISQVAKRLGVTFQAVWGWIRNGRLSARKDWRDVTQLREVWTVDEDDLANIPHGGFPPGRKHGGG